MSQRRETDDIRIVKQKTGGAVLGRTTPPTPTPGAGNPIFDTDPAVYAEAKRQLTLISEELNTRSKTYRHPRQNLLHVLRGIIDADRRSVVIKMSTRDEFIETENTSVAQTQELLAELEQAGHLEITIPRPKNHDYRPSKRAYDTWNSVQLYEVISPMKPVSSWGSPEERVEHYLVSFDAQLYLDLTPSRKPGDLEVGFSNYHLLPCEQGTIGVSVDGNSYSGQDNRRPVLVDLRDHEINPGDYRSAFHTKLYRYLGMPQLGDELDRLWTEVRGGGDPIVPLYVVEKGPDHYGHHGEIIFRGKRNRHYEVPRVFLMYLYNNYFGEDLDIRVSVKPTSTEIDRHGTLDRFLITVRRCGSNQPLLLYRFEQIREQLATIT